MGSNRAAKENLLRAIARLRSQARLNSAEAEKLNRRAEQAAWEDVGLLLELAAEAVAVDGQLVMQGRLFVVG
jgi:hypothetical protein